MHRHRNGLQTVAGMGPGIEMIAYDYGRFIGMLACDYGRFTHSSHRQVHRNAIDGRHKQVHKNLACECGMSLQIMADYWELLAASWGFHGNMGVKWQFLSAFSGHNIKGFLKLFLP